MKINVVDSYVFTDKIDINVQNTIVFIDFRLKMMRATFLAHSLMADLDGVSLFFITFIVVLTSFNGTNML